MSDRVGIKMALENRENAVQSKSVSFFRILVLSFSVISIISCLSIGLLTYNLRARGIREEQYRLLETLRDEKTGNLSYWFRERFGDLNVLVSRENIRIFCETDGDNKVISTDEIVAVLSNIKQSYQYEAIFLVSLEGNTLAGTKQRPLEPDNFLLWQETMEQSIREKRVINSDVLISKVHSKPIIFFFAPIFSLKTTEMTGMLEIHIDPAVWLYPLSITSNYLGETGEILMVNSNGIVQSPLKYREGAIALTSIQTEPSLRGAAGESGIIFVDDYRHEPVMAAYGYIDELNWGIVVKQDVSEINHPVWIMAINVLGISVGVLILTLLTGIYLSGKISRPALLIAETAELIGEGHLDKLVHEEGPAEIRKIAANMNAMVEKLSLQINATQGKNEELQILLEEEKKLKESKKKYRDFFERDSDAIFIYESDTLKIIDANEATSKIYGYDYDELIGMSCLNFFGDKESDSFADEFFRNDEEFFYNRLHQKKDGTKFSVDIRCFSKILGSRNERFAICRDITDRILAEDHMRETNDKLISTQSSLIREEKLASIGRLAAGVAHELNNPIGFINSNFRSLNRYVSLLQELFEDEEFIISEELKSKYKTDYILEDFIDILEESNEGLDRIIKIINSLRSFSRVDHNKSLSYFDLNESLKSTLVVAGNEIKYKAHIHTDFGEIPSIYGLAGEINQVLLNLIINACQAVGNESPDQMGNIFISTTKDESYVICRIKDDGPGIKEEDQLKIFDPFYTTKPVGEGTGLGLSISYDIIVNKHKGALYIENNSSEGAEFVIKLPIEGDGDTKKIDTY